MWPDRFFSRFTIFTPRFTAISFCILGAALLALNLGKGSLYPWDEALSAMRAWHMYTDGLSFTVSTSGGPDFNKPPLYYWLAAGTFHLLEPGLLALRLPSVAFALGCLGGVYFLGRKMTGSAWAGCFALACLAFNPHWLNFARLGKLETAVAFSLVAATAWGCYAKWRHTPAGGIVTALLLCISAWAKHPFFILLPPFFYAYWRFCDRAEKPLVPFVWCLGTFAVVGSGWYIISLCLWGGEFWRYYFEYNIAARVLHGVENHAEGFFFLIHTAFAYGPVAFLCFLASFPALVACWRKGERTAALAVVLAWLFLLGMSCMTGKRKIYIVSWYPLCAASAAYGACWLMRGLKKWIAVNPRNALGARMGRLITEPVLLGRCIALACVYAVVMTGVTYKATPDHSPIESAVFREAGKRLKPDALLITNVDAPAVLDFEVGRVADVAVPIQEEVAPLMETAFTRASSGKQVFLVIEEAKRTSSANMDLMKSMAAGFPGVFVSVIARSGCFWAASLGVPAQ